MSSRPAARSPALQALLYDPLAYLHPRRLVLPPALTASAAARAAANELLISAYRLDSDCADAQLDPLARQWLRHWRRLPQTAYLLGCHALRAGLGWQAGLLRLPDWAQDFAAVALPPDAAAAQRPALSHGALLLTGYGRLQAWRERLPRPLAQRLPLQFPPEADAAPPQPPADALILTLALQHAQRHPHIPPSDRR